MKNKIWFVILIAAFSGLAQAKVCADHRGTQLTISENLLPLASGKSGQVEILWRSFGESHRSVLNCVLQMDGEDLVCGDNVNPNEWDALTFSASGQGQESIDISFRFQGGYGHDEDARSLNCDL